MTPNKTKPNTLAATFVAQYAHNVLGDKAEAWLAAPHDALDGKSPNQCLQAWPGRVENLLIAMDEGF